MSTRCLCGTLDALDKLVSRKADVVRMSHEAIAVALEISIPTVERDWRFARAWLSNAVANPTEGANATDA